MGNDLSKMVHIGIVMTGDSRGDSQDESVAQWIEQELYIVMEVGIGGHVTTSWSRFLSLPLPSRGFRPRPLTLSPSILCLLLSFGEFLPPLDSLFLVDA